MKNEIFDQKMEALRKRGAQYPEQEFRPIAEFKADFFCRTEQTAKRKTIFFSPKIWGFAAGFVLLLGIVFVTLPMKTGKGGPCGVPLVVPNETSRMLPKPSPLSANAECNEVAALPAPASIPPLPAPMPPGKKEVLRKNDSHRLSKAKVSASASFVAMERNRVAGKLRAENADTSFSSPCPPMPSAAPDAGFRTEEYKHLAENPFHAVSEHPLSTFGADVDTAGYTNLRRMIQREHRLPPRDAVRIEEYLNYFQYHYPAPGKDRVFQTVFEMGDAPWAPGHKLLLIGVQAKKMKTEQLPPSNFVFLIDNSGSMHSVMPLVIDAMTMLTDRMRSQDKISVVTYGGGVRCLLDGESGSHKEKIRKLLETLRAGGYTPGGAGILEAYRLAHKNFIKNGNNRIILITDGDFNVGVSSESELVSLVEKERRSAVYLTAIGVGSGNYKDNKLKMLANKGNGNYFYLDNPRETRNAMMNEMSGRMFTLARDVKFQLEFNPARVHSYRLLGYEFRKLDNQDFNDDAKDSGEVGVGHQVTALYELIPADAPDSVKNRSGKKIDALKYQESKSLNKEEFLTLKLRYQLPEGNAPSVLQTFVVKKDPAMGVNLPWASSVAEFALLLRDSAFKGNASFSAVRKRAMRFLGDDENGSRAEFLTLVKQAEELARNRK